MGLTIHYTIEFKSTAKQLQTKLEKVRQACRDLPFEEVGEIGTVKITQKIIDSVFAKLSNDTRYKRKSGLPGNRFV